MLLIIMMRKGFPFSLIFFLWVRISNPLNWKVIVEASFSELGKMVKNHVPWIIWGGMVNHGRLKLRSGNGPEIWTGGVDLGHLLDLLELNLITTDEGLQEAMQEQRRASAAIVGSTVGESSPVEGTLPKDKTREIYEPLGLNIQQLPMEGASGIGLSPPFTHANFHVDGVNTANVEHQFIPDLLGMSPMHQDNGDNNPESNNLYSLGDAPEEESVSLQLGEREPKRQCSDSTFTLEDQK